VNQLRILITGGCGFIGSNLTRRLLTFGHSVRVLDDLSTGSPENLANLGQAVELRIGDVTSAQSVRESVADRDVVFHLAALPSVSRSIADPIRSHRVNVNGTLQVLLAARDAGVRRVVYASSSSVYGDTPTLPKDERMAVSPLSPYAASKLAGEAYSRAFSRAYGFETVSLRFFNVFGPRQDPSSEYAAVIPRFINRMMEGHPPEIFGDGSQSRDFTFVDNVVDACMLAAGAAADAIGEAINVGCGRRTTLIEVVDILNDLLGANLQPVFLSARVGDVRDSEAAISKAKHLLGYRPTVNFREGLASTIQWFAEKARPALTNGLTAGREPA
jgi:UDP-glucose 4-epimerase